MRALCSSRKTIWELLTRRLSSLGDDMIAQCYAQQVRLLYMYRYTLFGSGYEASRVILELQEDSEAVYNAFSGAPHSSYSSSPINERVTMTSRITPSETQGPLAIDGSRQIMCS